MGSAPLLHGERGRERHERHHLMEYANKDETPCLPPNRLEVRQRAGFQESHRGRVHFHKRVRRVCTCNDDGKW